MDIQPQAGPFTGTAGVALAPAVLPLIMAVPLQVIQLVRTQFTLAPAGINAVEPAVHHLHRAGEGHDLVTHLRPVLVRRDEGVPGILLGLERPKSLHDHPGVLSQAVTAQRLKRDGMAGGVPVDDVHLEGAVQLQFHYAAHRASPRFSFL